MKEQIIFKIDDLDDKQKTLEALLQLFEKVMFYYEDQDIQLLETFVKSMMTYWYLIYSGLQKEGDTK